MIRDSVRQLADSFARRVWRQGPFRKRGESFDVQEAANFLAVLESAQYFCDRMERAKICGGDLELLSYASTAAKLDGLVLEFGVASGRTLNHLAGLHGMVHGFDVFSGLPEAWRTGYEAGAFGRTGLPEVSANAHLHGGLFADTLPLFLAHNADEIRFVHIDCDLYSSTKDVLQLLAPRLHPGAVIVFDEYFNYPGWRHHEFRAFQEFVVAESRGYRYIGVVPSHQQVAVILE